MNDLQSGFGDHFGASKDLTQEFLGAILGGIAEEHIRDTLFDDQPFIHQQGAVCSGPGKTLVAFYYAHSPAAADFIAEHAGLRAIVRVGLLPLVGLSWIALKTGLVPLIGFILVLGICLIGLIKSTKSLKKGSFRKR